MAVIALPNVSPQGPSPVMEWGSKTFNEEFESPFTGQQQTYGNGANVARQSARLTFENLHRLTTAPVLKRFLGQCRGRANRFYVPDYSHTLRGSFPATELLTNNHFASGTTGWTPSGSQLSVTAADGVLRVQRIAVTGAGGIVAQSATVTQYAPYAFRGITLPGRGYSGGVRITESTIGGATTFAPGQLHTQAIVSAQTSYVFTIRDENTSGVIAGDYFGVAYASLARCMLVDNGPNALLHSDVPTNVAWTKTGATASAVGGQAPDGASDAEAIIEDGSTGFHFVQQIASRTSAAEDVCAYGYFKRRTGTRDLSLFVDDGAANGAGCLFNLNAGTAGTASATGTGTNPRAFIVSAGNSWFFCAVVARLPATTSMRLQAVINNAGNNSYAGDSSSSIYAWRMGIARASVPTRGAATAGTATTGVSQTGAALHLKGLPVSTSGLLVADDPAEIILPSGSQFVRTTAALNSDAAGLGYWQFEPPLRASPADGAAVIVCRPLMRAHLAENTVRWTERLGGFADLEFSCVEDMV